MIKQIKVFGERNSGTNFLTKLMKRNFEGVGFDKNFGWKHGDIGQKMKFYNDKNILKTTKVVGIKDPKSTLIVVITRNPFTWLQSMHRSPHHAPKHWHIPFHEFLNKKWQCYYSRPGQPSHKDKKIRMACAKPENLFEEYDNVLELRKDKMQIHKSFSKKLPNVAYITLEQLNAEGEKLIAELARIYNIKTKKAYRGVSEDKFGDKKYKKKKYSRVSSRDIKRIIKTLNWKEENRVGYYLPALGLKTLFSRSFANPSKLLDIKFKPIYFKDGKKI